MPKRITSDNAYRKLLQSIRNQIAGAKRVIEQQTVNTYWSTGRLMERHLKNNTAWGADIALARELSEDLDVHVRTLQQSLQFYRVYPKLNKKLPINWSEYCVLMSIDPPAKRARLEKRIVREDLNVDQLRRIVYESKMLKVDRKTKILPVRRGLLHHYHLRKVNYVSDAPNGIMLDCGFDSRIIPPPCNGRLENKHVVRAEKKDGRYTIVMSKSTTEKIFTYKAIVERVVDGDTLLANIDCGFGLWTRQYLRLNWINAMEMKDGAGLEAKMWVQSQLSRCPFVVVKTNKNDQFDRYLADIFYLPNETDPHKVAAEGKFLNQILLDKGLADVYTPKTFSSSLLEPSLLQLR